MSRRRLADDPSSDLRPLLRAASAGVSPPGVQARIWQRLTQPQRRMFEAEADDPAVVALVKEAASVEPPPGSRERIWNRLMEEHAARAGLSEPRRLLATDDLSAQLLARAAALEPPFARGPRLYRAMEARRRPRYAFAGVGGLAAAFALLLVLRSNHSTAPVTSPALVVHAHGSEVASELAVGGSLAPQSDDARWQVDGVGDTVLSGGGKVTLVSADSHGVRLALGSGRLALHATKRSPTAPLVIEAGGVEVRVVGTILAVEVRPAGAAVFVHEGLVQVTANGEETLVAAGQSWPTSNVTTSWADDAMRTLAGGPLAMRQGLPAAAAPARSTESLPLPPPITLPIPRRTAKPASRTKVALAAQGPDVEPSDDPTSARPSSVESAGPAEPPTVSAEPENHHQPLVLTQFVAPGPQLSLEKLAEKYRDFGPDDLEAEIRRLVQQGADGRSDLAGAYRALANAPEADDYQRRTAILALAKLLDEKLGWVQMAVDVRRDGATRLDATDLSMARLGTLEDLVEMGRMDDALHAAADCLKDCTGDARVTGEVIEAYVLSLAGRSSESKGALQAAVETPNAIQHAVLYFEQRSNAYKGNGQLERARVASKIAEALQAP
jgi:ferric-dicitrate binding protein FerR (iron transport regulator)